MPDSELRGHLFELPYLAYRRQLWQRASLFLCVSRFIRDKALRAGFPEYKLRIQYTGLNLSAYTPTLPVSEKDPNMVLYVGRLVPYKGCDYLLRAMQRVQHIFFPAGLSLLASERIAGNNVRCFQGDNVLASGAINAAVQHGLDAITLTDFTTDIGGDAIAGAAPHELQCLADLLIGKNV